MTLQIESPHTRHGVVCGLEWEGTEETRDGSGQPDIKQ